MGIFLALIDSFVLKGSLGHYRGVVDIGLITIPRFLLPLASQPRFPWSLAIILALAITLFLLGEAFCALAYRKLMEFGGWEKIVKPERLIQDGVYAVIRHTMYLGLEPYLQGHLGSLPRPSLGTLLLCSGRTRGKEPAPSVGRGVEELQGEGADVSSPPAQEVREALLCAWIVTWRKAIM